MSVYVTGPSGTITSADVDLIQAAVLLYCTPLTITPTVTAADPVVVDVRYSVWVYRSVKLTSEQLEDAIQSKLALMFSRLPIGGDRIDDVGKLYVTRVEDAILDAIPDVESHAFRIVVLLDGVEDDVALLRNEVATLGTVTPAIFFEDDPS